MKGNKKRLEILVFFLFDWQQKKTWRKHGKDIGSTPFIFRIFLVLKYFRKEECNEINAKRN
ncbi:hypothetical protein ABE17_09695 [Bacillus mycoides]|nr:hypothetical protein [Bacillus mycoides]MCD4642337.1 hypothetical protein [Bacillus mycoides]OOR57359.1 hypothetical protein BGP34_14460 [Bacillus mycoides]